MQKIKISKIVFQLPDGSERTLVVSEKEVTIEGVTIGLFSKLVRILHSVMPNIIDKMDKHIASVRTYENTPLHSVAAQ